MTREEQDRLHQTQSRYMPLVLVVLTHAFIHMYGALLPLVYPFIVIEYGISYAAIGLLEGVSRFSAGLSQGPAGLLGRFVPRNILLGLGNLLLALSMGLTSLSANFVQFFAATVFGRIAQSPQHPIGSSLISEWFGKKLRGTTFAINYSGANMGSIIVPLIAGGLFLLVGWRGTLGIFIFPGLVFGLLAIIMLSGAGKVVTTTSGSSRPNLGSEIRMVFKDPNSRFVIVSAMLSAGAGGLGILNIYVPLYLRDTIRDGLGLEPMTTSILYTILLVGSVVGPLFMGRISDRFGRIRTIKTILFLSSLNTVLLVLSGSNLSSIIPVLLAMGFTNYSYTALLQALLADVANPSVRDLTFSLFYPLSFGVGAIWSFGLGVVADQFGFRPMFLISAISPLIALPFIWILKE
ncbi:MFS transporter [Chloroflexota bacterium]